VDGHRRGKYDGTVSDRAISIAMGQMLVLPGQLRRNLERACQMIAEAGAKGCQAIVLPECLDVGWTDPSTRTHAKPIPGESFAVLAAAAKSARIHVAAGLSERDGDRIFNAAVLIGPDGALLAKHRKICELTIAHDLYALGDQLSTVDTGLGRVGLAICADLWPDTGVARALAEMRARLILSPAAWAGDCAPGDTRESMTCTWLASYQDVARDFPTSVIGVSNVGPVEGGPWKGKKCIGSSLAVAAGGQVLAQGRYGEACEELLVVEVPMPPEKQRLGGADVFPMKARR
jgi:predicted amidohydrolase